VIELSESKPILPVKSDIVFRLFFADERNIEFLTGFLKSVLKVPEDDYELIEILDPHLLRDFNEDKLSIIDVKLRTKSRKTIQIEIQLRVTPELKNRIVYYDAKLVTEQIGDKGKYAGINKVISIVITEDDLILNSPRYHHQFTFYDPDAGVELTDLIEIHTLELRKLPDGADGTELYDWARFIIADTDEELNMLSERNPQIGKAVVKLRELSADEEARDLYERRMKAQRDEDMRIRWAEQQAMQKGQFEFARKLLKRGRPIEEIAEDTGLTLAEIQALQ